jgi:phage gp46-like protein
MTDLKIRWGADGGDLEIDPIARQDLRGFWGGPAGDPFGSLLWLLEREKRTQQVLERARATVRSSLAWMVEQGLAREVTVTAVFIGREGICLSIAITRGSAPRWDSIWRASEDVHLKLGDTLLELSIA